jgi:hypothetical protein
MATEVLPEKATMKGGMLYEHGRWMLATTVGLPTVVTVIGLFCSPKLRAAARHNIWWVPVVTGVILWVALRILIHYARNLELRPELRAAAVRRNLPDPSPAFAPARVAAVL